jgi:hypothetical protein
MTGSSEAETEAALLYEKQGGVATLTLNRIAASRNTSGSR